MRKFYGLPKDEQSYSKERILIDHIAQLVRDDKTNGESAEVLHNDFDYTVHSAGLAYELMELIGDTYNASIKRTGSELVLTFTNGQKFSFNITEIQPLSAALS